MKYRIHNLPNYGEVKVYWLGTFMQMFTRAITLFGKIRCSDMILTDILVRHEVIHRDFQAKEVKCFTLRYVWISLRYGYKKHPMEMDANEFEKDIDFVKNRPANNWKNYK